MTSLRTASVATRCIGAALLGLLLALRLLNPAGFMPSFDRGAVTIIVCPDASYQPVSTVHMHHKHQSKHREQCPYASASSLEALGSDFTPLLGGLVLVAALLLGRTFAFIERHSRQLRPPPRGPPATA